MKKFILFIVLSFLQVNYSGYFLKRPLKVSSEDITQMEQGRRATFTFELRDFELIFDYDDEKVGIILKFFNAFPKELEEYRDKFTKKMNFESVEYEFRYGYFNPENDGQEQNEDYYLADPLELHEEKNLPQELTIDDILSLIKNSNVIFYTGAGISAAAGIYTLRPLMKALGIETNESFKSTIVTDLMHNPDKIEQIFKDFCAAAFSAPATKAHYALAKIVNIQETQVVTENFDFLQERAGIKPIHLCARTLLEESNVNELEEIDFIICVALSHDDRGFLAWYKEHNPTGKLLAINLTKPSYLDKKDFIFFGDVQEVLPIISDRLK